MSTTGQAETGYGLPAQRTLITDECVRRGLALLKIETDTASGKSTDKRAGLTRALSALSAGRADTLVVTKLDRLARSVIDFAALLQRAQREEWNLIILDLGVDLATPSGRMVAGVVSVLAQFERELISERTRAGLAEAARQGVIIGRSSSLPDETVTRIVADRERGLTLQAVADALNTDGVPTGQGAPAWTRQAVAAVLASRRGRELSDE